MYISIWTYKYTLDIDINRLGATPRCAQGLPLAPCSGIIADSAWGTPHSVGIELGSATKQES